LHQWESLEHLRIERFEFYGEGEKFELPLSQVIVSSYPKGKIVDTPLEWAAVMFQDMRMVYTKYGLLTEPRKVLFWQAFEDAFQAVISRRC
jgi:hypothetical protein